MIWATVVRLKSGSPPEILARKSFSVAMPTTRPWSTTTTQETLFADMTWAAQTAAASGATVITSALITSFTSSQTREQVIKRPEQMSMTFASTDSPNNLLFSIRFFPFPVFVALLQILRSGNFQRRLA